MKSKLVRSITALATVALFTATMSGCAWVERPRKWGACTVLGAAIGAGAGAASGIVIVDNTRGHTETAKSAKVYAGVGGAVAGALIGGLAGHLLCDEVIQPPPPPPPQPPPPPPPPPPLPRPAPVKLILRGVHFDFNKSIIRPGDAAVLDEVAQILKANPNVTVNVNGYCDAIGSVEYNLKLSERRANAVVDYLVKAGIPSSQLIPHGYGKTNFVATNDTPEGRAQNRRVELVPNE